ncbi:CBP4 domain-containing protein [Cordyceps javanica]|nr:CBP4 domain-containing protein [Cordyceps javanica]
MLCIDDGVDGVATDRLPKLARQNRLQDRFNHEHHVTIVQTKTSHNYHSTRATTHNPSLFLLPGSPKRLPKRDCSRLYNTQARQLATKKKEKEEAATPKSQVMAKPTNWGLWAKVIIQGIGVSVGGPALTYWVVPTEEELRSRYNPDLLRKSIEGRADREAEFNEFVTKLKQYSKSDKPSTFFFCSSCAPSPSSPPTWERESRFFADMGKKLFHAHNTYSLGSDQGRGRKPKTSRDQVDERTSERGRGQAGGDAQGGRTQVREERERQRQRERAKRPGPNTHAQRAYTKQANHGPGDFDKTL